MFDDMKGLSILVVEKLQKANKEPSIIINILQTFITCKGVLKNFCFCLLSINNRIFHV